MRNLIIIIPVFVIGFASMAQDKLPDLNNKEDLKLLGIGSIIEKDQRIIKNGMPYEVKEFWIVYEKKGSLHDLDMEKIDSMEFPESKWGPLKLEFRGNIPGIIKMWSNRKSGI